MKHVDKITYCFYSSPYEGSTSLDQPGVSLTAARGGLGGSLSVSF